MQLPDKPDSGTHKILLTKDIIANSTELDLRSPLKIYIRTRERMLRNYFLTVPLVDQKVRQPLCVVAHLVDFHLLDDLADRLEF